MWAVNGRHKASQYIALHGCQRCEAGALQLSTATPTVAPRSALLSAFCSEGEGVPEREGGGAVGGEAEW